jgi:hypothetical protein
MVLVRNRETQREETPPEKMKELSETKNQKKIKARA